MRPAVEHKGTGPNQKGFQEKINEADNVHRVLIGLHNSPLRGRPRGPEHPSTGRSRVWWAVRNKGSSLRGPKGRLWAAER